MIHVEPLPFLAAFVVAYALVFVFPNQVLAGVRKALVFLPLKRRSAGAYLVSRGWKCIETETGPAYLHPRGDGCWYEEAAALVLENARRK